MGGDVFSNYIKNLKRVEETEKPQAGSMQRGSGSQYSPGNWANQSGFMEQKESIAILKEISSKLDKLQTPPAAPQTIVYAPPASQIPLASPGVQVDIAIVNGLVVLPDNGVFPLNVYIKGGKIHSIGNDASIQAAKVIDASGKYVLPGIIDPHVHLGLFAPMETELDTETKSALYGGVTTIGCYIGGVQSHFESFPKIQEDIGRYAYTDVIPHLVIGSEVQRKEIREYIEAFGITSFKVYMNGIPGMIPDVDDGFIMDVLSELKKSGKRCMLCSHAENRYLVRRANQQVREEKGNCATVEDWTETHPDMAEEEAVIRLSYLAEKSGVPVYFVHISSKLAIDRLRNIKAKNKYVTVETTSPYLSLTKNSSTQNTIKMEPPFRSMEDVEELWNAVEDGVVDTIGTDNVTMTKAEKNIDAESMWDAMPGYPALQTHLPALLNEGVVKRGIPIEKLIVHMTKKPAEKFGVYPQKGTILPGSDGDVVIVDMNMVKEVSAQTLHSRSDFSLYEGKRLQGWPVTTIKGGQVVIENGVYVGSGASGRCLKR